MSCGCLVPAAVQMEDLNTMKDNHVVSGLTRLASPTLPAVEARTVSVSVASAWGRLVFPLHRVAPSCRHDAVSECRD